MAEWFALYYPLKPGTEETVGQLFRDSGRPQHDVVDEQGNVVGKLLRTLVFVGAERAVRVIEVEGDLRIVAGHMSRQAEVKEFERAIEDHLAEPRDMQTPEGARSFFQKAGMRCVLDRQWDR